MYLTNNEKDTLFLQFRSDIDHIVFHHFTRYGANQKADLNDLTGIAYKAFCEHLESIKKIRHVYGFIRCVKNTLLRHSGIGRDVKLKINYFSRKQ